MGSGRLVAPLLDQFVHAQVEQLGDESIVSIEVVERADDAGKRVTGGADHMRVLRTDAKLVFECSRLGRDPLYRTLYVFEAELGQPRLTQPQDSTDPSCSLCMVN